MLLKPIHDIVGLPLALTILAIPKAITALAMRAKSRGLALRRSGFRSSIPKFGAIQLYMPLVFEHLPGDATWRLRSRRNFPRKESPDEPTHLWCVSKEDLRFVRSLLAFWSQHDLMATRTAKNGNSILPSFTGRAQIKCQDGLAIVENVTLDGENLQDQNSPNNLRILGLIGIKVAGADRVQHF